MDTEKRLSQSLKTELTVNKIKIGKYLINYAVSGSGKPLLLIHGGNLGWGQWYKNIPQFAKHFKVVAIDLPGAGRSTKVDFARMDLKKDLFDVVANFIQALKLKNFHIIGTSIGGWIALELALKPEISIDKLVVGDCIGFTSYMRFSERIIAFYPFAKLISKTALKPVRSNKNIEKFLRSVFFDVDASLSKEFLDYFYETMESSHNLLFISRLASVWGVRSEFLLGDELSKIKNKTLIIWGQGDKLMPFAKSSENFELLPNKTIEEMKGAGHFPNLEKSTEFNNVVLKFLEPN